MKSVGIPARWLGISFLLLLAGCSEVSDQEYFTRAEQLFSQEDLAGTEIELKNALGVNPGNGQARELLGRVYLQRGNFAAAAKELEKALELGGREEAILPSLARALSADNQNDKLQALSMGEVLPDSDVAIILAAQGTGNLAAGNITDAQNQIDIAMSLAAESPYVLVARSRLSIALWEVDAAQEEAERALDIDPAFVPAMSLLADIYAYQNKLGLAEEYYTKAIESSPLNTAELLARARLRLNTGDFTGAQADLDTLKPRLKNHPGLNYAQGLLYFSTGETDAAQEAFEQVLAVSPRHKDAAYYLATINYRKGNLSRAENLANIVHAESPASIEGRKLLATILLERRDYERSLEIIEPVVAADGSDVPALLLMANARNGLGDSAGSISLYDKAVALSPEEAGIRIVYAKLLLSQDKQSGKAEEQLRKAIELEPGNQDARSTLISYYMNAQDYEAALAEVRHLEQLDFDPYWARNVEARVLLASGEREEGIAALRAIVSDAPADISANTALAQIAAAENDLASARSYYEAILAANPDDYRTLITLAELEKVAGNEARMIELLEQAMTSSPSADLPSLLLARHYTTYRKFDKVPELLARLSDRAKKVPEALEVRGLMAIQREDYSNAVTLFEELVSAVPESPRAHFLLSLATSATGDVNRTGWALEKAVELEPGNARTRLALARFYIATGNAEQAAEQVAIMSAEYPDWPELKATQALVARMQGDRQVAQELFIEVFEQAPTTKSLGYAAAEAWARGDRETAFALQEKWIEDNPEDTSATMMLATTQLLDDRAQSAAESFEKVVQVDKDNPVALNELAWLLREKDPEKALGYARRANEIDPRQPAFIDTLAVVLFYNEEYDLAAQTLNKALQSFPSNPTLLFHRAMIEAGAGKATEAVATLESILADNPEFPEREEALALLAELK